ncbi:MAG: hypothetical protein KDE27_11620, partial [Planctomycetes bacterium]|nr:hypothetical protein [Planctomycetota bacterium]
TALAVAFAAASQLLLAAPAADRTPLPSSAAVAFTDDLRDLPGCLPRRYLVLSALAAAERADALADREPSPIR